MKRTFTKLMAALALLTFLAVPMGMWGQTRADELAYSLTITKNTSNSGYANYYDITVNSVGWKAPGNQALGDYIKIGGKPSGDDRYLYSKTAIDKNITKVVVTHGDKDSQITVNSMVLTVYSTATNAANGTNPIATISGTFVANGNTVFEKQDNTDWSNCFYRINYNLSSSATSKNYGFIFTKAEFYYSPTPSGPTQLSAPELVATAGNGEVTLTWETVTGASSYTIQYDDNSSFSDPTTVGNATSPKVISGLTNNTTYYFRAMSVGNGTDYISSSYGTAVSAKPNNYVTITINRSSIDETISGYNYYEWTDSGISGEVWAYQNNSAIQTNVNSGNANVYNETAIPGIIKSVRIVKASGSDRTWSLRVANSTITGTSEGTEVGSQTVGTSGAGWDISGNYDHFLLYVTGGAFYIASIQVTYEPKTQYAVNVIVNSDYGTITATPTAAIEGATVSLSATATDYYRFESFTVLDANNSPVAVTSTGATTGTFTMPACAVTVSGTYTRVYTANVAGPYTGGTVIASPEKAAEGESVELTATAVDHYTFASWSVNAGTLSSTTDNPTTLTMPAADVTVDATFTRNTYTVTYCVNGNSALIPSQQVLGGNSIGSFPEDPEYGDYSFLGWSLNENLVNFVDDSYIPMGDMTLYAVFGAEGTGSLTIYPSDVPSSYSSSYNSVSVSNVEFMMKNVMNQNSIQFKNNAGGIYNKDSFGKIESIKVVYLSNATKNITVKPNSSASASSSEEAISPAISGDTYTFAFTGDYGYFLMTNGNAATQLYSITINYKTQIPVETIVTRIKNAQNRTDDIPETEFVIVENGGILTFTGANNGTFDNLVIEDGGQIILAEDNTGVKAKVQKNITGYGEGNGNWYLLSAPTDEGLNANPRYPDDCEVVNLMPADNGNVHMFDLYSFDQTKSREEWQNFRNPDVINKTFNKQKGLLYARKESATLEFNVQLLNKPNNNHRMLYEANAEFAGWNLVGNAMMCDQYVCLYQHNACVTTDYYRMNAAGTALELCENGAPVAPMEGFFVQAPSDAQYNVYLHFSSTPLVDNNNAIDLNVTYNNAIVDRARVRLGEGSMLGKFTLNENNTKLYIPQGSKDYAVVRSANEGEMPVNFKAEKSGSYTINVEAENVEMSYLHLFDNKTGADVDLLATPSYTFEASNDDYESRFRLVFKANADVEENTATETFAYFNGSEWVINNPSTGSDNATLQVVDMKGRVLSSETISGNANVTLNQAAGIYVLRLVNGENVMVQKVVVR